MGKRVKFGSLRRLEPLSRRWGYDRGNPIDRYYIEKFLEENAARIHGTVLEIKNRDYTERFGGERVGASEILDIDPTNEDATIVADIMQPSAFVPNQFDCIIFTQVLQLIREPARALETLHYILKPGGVLLITCPGITRIETKGPAAEWYWSFTPLSLGMVLENAFGRKDIAVASCGNVFAASCFLWGMAEEEIESDELDYQDPRFPVVLTACVTKD